MKFEFGFYHMFTKCSADNASSSLMQQISTNHPSAACFMLQCVPLDFFHKNDFACNWHICAPANLLLKV